MKKTGSKRGHEYEGGTALGVLDAPEESSTPEYEARSSWQGRGVAPAGALQRGFGRDGGTEDLSSGPEYEATDEPEYVPRRGRVKAGLRGVLRTKAGKILLGVAAVVVLGAIGVAVAAVRHYMLSDPRFVLASSDLIQISGAEHLTRDQILNVFGADLERNIFRMSLPEREADLERLPWVEHATVMRLLPNGVRILIQERTPVAFVRQGTQIGLVDGHGVLLDMQGDGSDAHYSFPVLTGLTSSMPLQVRSTRVQLYRDFMAALGRAGTNMADSLSEVDVADPEDVKALIASGGSDVLVHFGDEQFLKRYQEFEQHLPEWKQMYPRLSSADMRYEGQVVLEMQGGAPGATGAPNDASVSNPAEAAPTHAPVAAAVLPTVSHADSKATTVASASTANNAARKQPPSAKPVSPRKSGTRTVASAKATTHAVARRERASRSGADGKNAANQRVFAALAAAHRAALAKAAASRQTRAINSDGAMQ